MREIKFKLWNVKKKKFYGPYSIYKINYGDSDPDEWIPVEYAGIPDKNDRDIYEGEIWNIGSHYEGDTYYKEYIGVVVFREGEFFIEGKGEYEGCDLFDAIHNWGNHIGNIYENPELLKE